MMQCIQPNRDGFALSIVLWIVAALLLGIAFIVSISKDNLTLTKRLHYKLDARFEAESMLEVLKFAIITSNYDSNGLIINEKLPYTLPKKIVLDGRSYAVNKNITISLQDVSGMLNVRYPDAKMIALLTTNENENQLKYTIEDSINDWSDKDNIVRLNGAEVSFYELKKGLNYGPRNSPALQSVDELRLINGLNTLSSLRWNSLKKEFYYGDGVTVNLALINSDYLAKLLKLNLLEAERLAQYRKDDFSKFVKIIRKNKNYNDEYMGFALSFKIKIDIIVKNHSSISELHTFINFRSLSKSSVSINKFEIY